MYFFNYDIIIYKGTFPSAEGQPIPSIIVELKLDKASKMSQDGKYYKILPIEINFNRITSYLHLLKYLMELFLNLQF